MSVVIPWDDTRKRERPTGYSIPFIGEELGARKLHLHISCIAPGTRAHDPHLHEEAEEAFFILEGTGEAMVGEDKLVVGPNTAVYCPPGKLHGLLNCGQTPLKYMVIIAK